MRYALRPLAVALVAALAGCGGGTAPSVATVASKAADAARPDANALAAEIADTLQACSYDGSPVKVDATDGQREAPADCRDMVSTIMRHTGLPQNFDVVQADVPNAAAVILLDRQKLPHRVIAFNPQFIDAVKRATHGNAWAPVSIMAHEIGHHLSGHTIMPGGSQPPTELEADKFSGFVLYRMGAKLDDATRAIVSLVSDGPDGATHPGRAKRVGAITDGWRQACTQAGRSDCADDDAGAMAGGPMQTPVDTASAPRPEPAIDVPGPMDAPVAAAGGGRDVIPAPGSTPSKFDRFVYDAYGVLSPDERSRVEKTMFEHARDSGVEVVTLLTDDLHGMSAQDYAYAMMRQLRVGKLDVGNGAVVVVAPKENDVGIAMGPGVMLENRDYIELDAKRLRSFLDMGWDWCMKKGDCGGWSSNFFGASEHIASGTKTWEWTIRYPSLASMLDTYQREFDARMKSGARYEPSKDPTWRKIARITATVASLDPPRNDRKRAINTVHEKMVGPAMLVRADHGRDVMLYMDPHTTGLMPAGRLQPGRTYSFVVRESSLGSDTPQFDVLSYDLLR